MRAREIYISEASNRLKILSKVSFWLKRREDLHRYMDEKGETFDIVLFDLPGTLRSEGVVLSLIHIW